MSTLFPTALDAFINPTGAQPTNTPSVLHHQQHGDLNDAVAALEAKVGINGSTVTSSLDWKLSHLSTDSVAEGVTNLYFTSGRAAAAAPVQSVAGLVGSVSGGGLKSALALNNVENTALSTWAGSVNLTTLGTIATGVWQGTTIAVAQGGTGQITAGAAFNALAPVTTLGDLIYGSGSNASTRLAGNTAATRKFLRQTGSGSVSAAPAWDTVLAADIPGSALTKIDDTNVTLTLGGTPATALLAAASLTLGWSGQLAIARGGTGAATANGAFNALAPSQGSNSGKYLTTDGNNTSWGTVTVPLAANPSGLIGMTAANGVATTFERSDATHAIDPAIVPTWTGQHTFQAQTSAKAAVFKAAVTTPGNITEWQASDGTVLASVVPGTAVTAQLLVPSGSATAGTGPSLAFIGSTNYGFSGTGGNLCLWVAGNISLAFTGSEVRFSRDNFFSWSSGATNNAYADTAIARNAAGIVEFRTAASGNLVTGGYSAFVCGSPTATTVGVTIKGATAQSGNMLECQKSDGTALTLIDATGRLGIGGTPRRTLEVLAAGSAIIQLTQTNAAADGKCWYWDAEGGSLYWGACSDNQGSGTNYAQVSRSGVTVNSFDLMINAPGGAAVHATNSGMVTVGSSGAPGAQLHVIVGSSSVVGQIVKGAASRTATLLQLQTSAGDSLGNVGGCIFDHYIDSATTHTDGTEDTLYTDTLAANTLAVNGDKVSVEYGGTFVSSATATRRLKVYFAGTVALDTGALTVSLSSAWTIYATFIRVSATVVRYMVSLATEGAALAAYTAVGEITGLTLTGTNIIKVTGIAAGTGAAASDITAKLGALDWRSAA